MAAVTGNAKLNQPRLPLRSKTAEEDAVVLDPETFASLQDVKPVLTSLSQKKMSATQSSSASQGNSSSSRVREPQQPALQSASSCSGLSSISEPDYSLRQSGAPGNAQPRPVKAKCEESGASELANWPDSALDFALDSLGEGEIHDVDLEGGLPLPDLQSVGDVPGAVVLTEREGGGESAGAKVGEGCELAADTREDGTSLKREDSVGAGKNGSQIRVQGDSEQLEGSKRQGSEREGSEKSCSGVSQKAEEEEETIVQSGRKASKKEGKRKVKVDWTPDLHRRFVQAVEQLGVEKAIPSRILELMGVQCLTRHNIASHLQKYRSHRRHLLAREAEAANWHQRRPMDVTSLSRMRRDGTAWVTLPINPSPPQPVMASRPAVGIPPHMPSILPAPSHHMAMAAAAHMPMQVMHSHAHAHPHPHPAAAAAAAAAAMQAARSGAPSAAAAAAAASSASAASAMGMPLHVWGHPAMDHSPMHMWQQPMGMCPPPAWYGPDGSLWQYPAMMQAPPPMMDAVWGHAPSSVGMPAVPGTPYCATSQLMASTMVCGTPATTSTATATSAATTATSADVSLSAKEVSAGEEGSVADGSGTVCSSAAAATTMEDLMLVDDNMPSSMFLPTQDLTSLDFAVMSCFADDFPENASNDVLDAAISEALTNPMTPLPLGLKPPSMDGLMAELEKQGICMASALEGTLGHEMEGEEGTIVEGMCSDADDIDGFCSGGDADISLPSSWESNLETLES